MKTDDNAMERERIEALMLGETEPTEWETRKEDGRTVRFAWWHEGAPHWYDNDPSGEYRTAVVFGFGPHPQLAGWTLMGTYGLGDRECLACATDYEDRPPVGTDCPLCECAVEADRGGFIYLGEDCAEAVYRRRRVGPDEWAHLTEDGFRVEAYAAGGFLDYGMRVTAPGGTVMFDCPFYLSAESFGVDDETGEPWDAECWQEAIALEAEEWLDGHAEREACEATDAGDAR